MRSRKTILCVYGDNKEWYHTYMTERKETYMCRIESEKKSVHHHIGRVPICIYVLDNTECPKSFETFFVLCASLFRSMIKC